MGAPQQESEGLVGGPGVSYGLCWLRASLELGRSRRAAARLPFWVKAGRVSTDTERLFNGDTEAAGLLRVVSSSRTHPLSGLLAPQKKVRDSGCEEREESQLIKVQRKVDLMRRHTPLARQSLPPAKLDTGEGIGDGGLKPFKILKVVKPRKKTGSSKLTSSAKTFFKVKSPDNLAISESEMDGSASRGQELEVEVEAGGEDSSQSGRHSLDSQQLPVKVQGTPVDRQKVGKDLDKEGTVPQSVFSLVNMSQGSETPASPPPPRSSSSGSLEETGCCRVKVLRVKRAPNDAKRQQHLPKKSWKPEGKYYFYRMNMLFFPTRAPDQSKQQGQELFTAPGKSTYS
ncbi:hypothetical protein NDU88_002105 [Pleurodeles waltl]|uniref:Uncharacterized protein n=1 Tax=Pleurodeles waltl TaxID=8319 RepID=A0AAV7MMT3_PLEWA|nr:hypothetical protein NDU88_002105 [Pleurodeles waltl]